VTAHNAVTVLWKAWGEPTPTLHLLSQPRAKGTLCPDPTPRLRSVHSASRFTDGGALNPILAFDVSVRGFVQPPCMQLPATIAFTASRAATRFPTAGQPTGLLKQKAS